MKIELKTKILNDKYTEYVYESFDIQNKEFTNLTIEANLKDLPNNWNIGVVYGGSGSGKTTILREYFKKDFSSVKFDKEKALISNFDWLEPKDATFLLTSMGLSSVPTWLRPFHTLSNGEQYRAELAYLVGKSNNDEIILIDEYTSVVDRDVAKAMSVALSKYIRRTNKRIVLASCHFDIMEWLQPDWIYSPLKRRLETPRLNRPRIELQIVRCRYETWDLFKQHHYLSEDLNKASKCFLALWNDKPVAFFATLPLPSGYLYNSFRMSRTVVLPDYQGLGIGNIVSKYIASLYKKNNFRFFVKTSNPALGETRLKDVKSWKETSKSRKRFNEKSKKDMSTNIWGFNNKDYFYAFEYIGKPSDDNDEIIRMKTENYIGISQNQISLF